MSDARIKVPEHFSLFLAVAGITTVRRIRENALDIRATRAWLL